MTNFEAFRWNFSLSINLKIGRSACLVCFLLQVFDDLIAAIPTFNRLSYILTYYILLPISEFELDEMFQRKASIFAIFCIYENPKLLFPFFISCNFTFFLINALVNRPRHSLGEK